MKPIVVDDLFTYKFLSGLSLSSSKKYLSFTTSKANLDTNGYDVVNYMYDIQAHTFQELTSDYEKFLWCNDDALLGISYQDDKTIIDKLDLKQNLIANITNIDGKCNNLVYCADCNKVYFTKIVSFEKDSPIYTQITEMPFVINGEGFREHTRNVLYQFDITTKVEKAISSLDEDVDSFKLIKGNLIYQALSFKRIRSAYVDRIVQYKDEVSQLLIAPETYNVYNATIFKGKIYALLSPMLEYGRLENPSLYSVEDESIRLIQKCDYAIGNNIDGDCSYGATKQFYQDDDYLYVLISSEFETKVARFDEFGNVSELGSNDVVMDDFVVDKNTNSLYLLGFYHDKLSELYAYDYLNDKLQQLSTFNEESLQDYYIAKWEPISVEVMGKDIHGQIMWPQNKMDKYPVILEIHGGPRSSYGRQFFHQMQAYCASGYVIISCNPIGSSGRGNEFANLAGKVGKEDATDILEFLQYCLNKYPQLDANKVACVGGSYGGYMTNWLITRHKFACAISQRSISNWVVEYTNADLGYYYVPDNLNTGPWSGFDDWWNVSPLKYANQCETPTLFIHGDQDHRCDIANSYQMYAGLMLSNVPTKLCIFHGENHELSRSGHPLSRQARLIESLAWLKKYMMEE